MVNVLYALSPAIAERSLFTITYKGELVLLLMEVKIMDIRQVEKSDLWQLLKLYTQLHGNDMPEAGEHIDNLWGSILADKNHHIIIGLIGDEIVSSCVIVIVPNLTHNQRPYAIIENVITHEAHRNKGYAASILDYAKDIAKNENCYKIMLLTSSQKESTLNFYERAGYNRNDKTAFIQWL